MIGLRGNAVDVTIKTLRARKRGESGRIFIPVSRVPSRNFCDSDLYVELPDWA